MPRCTRFTPNNTHTHTQKKKQKLTNYIGNEILYIYIDYMTVLFPGMCFLQNKSMATSNIRLFPSHTGATNRLLHGIMTPQLPPTTPVVTVGGLLLLFKQYGNTSGEIQNAGKNGWKKTVLWKRIPSPWICFGCLAPHKMVHAINPRTPLKGINLIVCWWTILINILWEMDGNGGLHKHPVLSGCRRFQKYKMTQTIHSCGHHGQVDVCSCSVIRIELELAISWRYAGICGWTPSILRNKYQHGFYLQDCPKSG